MNKCLWNIYYWKTKGFQYTSQRTARPVIQAVFRNMNWRTNMDWQLCRRLAGVVLRNGSEIWCSCSQRTWMRLWMRWYLEDIMEDSSASAATRRLWENKPLKGTQRSTWTWPTSASSVREPSRHGMLLPPITHDNIQTKFRHLGPWSKANKLHMDLSMSSFW